VEAGQFLFIQLLKSAIIKAGFSYPHYAH